MKFKLQSKFKPTGDQPQAIDLLTKGYLKKSDHQTLLGVTGSGKTFTLANVIQNIQKPTLIISHNKTLAGQLYQEFRDFFPENAVSYFVSYYDYYQPESYIPSTDTYIEKETDINDEIDKLRLSTTANLLSRKDVIVIASVSCIYNLGSPIEYAKNFIQIVPGQIISAESLMTRFVDIQYSRSDYELTRGTFQLKGEALRIWPANFDHALKIDILENSIESITPIDPVSGQVLADKLDTHHSQRFSIYPAKHYQSATDNQKEAFKQIKHDLALRLSDLKNQGKIVESYRLGQKVKHDLEMIQELGYVNGIENYSRYFDGRNPGDPPYTLLDYFKHNAKEFQSHQDDFLTIVDESHITLPQLRGMYKGDQSRKQTLIDYGFRLPSALDNRPLKFDEILERLPHIIHASATPQEWELHHSKSQIAEQLIRPTGLVDPEVEIKPTKNQITDLIHQITARKKKGQRALVTTLTKKTAEALTEYLNDKDKLRQILKSEYSENIVPKVQYLHADVDTLDRQDILDDLRTGEYDVVVGINLLREGLDLPEVTLVAILEADMQGFLRSRSSLIQIMGRAARHSEGHVIMYADKTSPAMREAIDEVNRRRKVQIAYNQKHHITPETISKPIREKLLTRVKESEGKNTPKELKEFGWDTVADIKPEDLTPSDKSKLIKKLKSRMNEHAKAWDFEKAAQIRDTIKRLES